MASSIFRNITIVATRGQILSLKCTKFSTSAEAPPESLAGFKGPTSKKREGRGKENGGRERKGKEREGRRWKGKGRRGKCRVSPPTFE